MGRDFRDKGISGGHVTGLISAYIDGALGAAEQEQVRAHIATCFECRADYVELKAAKSALRALPTEAAPRAFTLTREMVSARPASRATLLSRLPAPAFAPRLATGSLVAFVLLLLVVVGDWSVARQVPAPAVTALQANNQGVSAYNATAPEDNRKTASANTTITGGGATSQDVPKLAEMGTPNAGATANTDMANTQAPPAAGGMSAATSGEQATAGMMSSTTMGATPMPESGAAGGSGATAPTIGASGNSSPTTVALAAPNAVTSGSAGSQQAQPAQPHTSLPNTQPKQAPAPAAASPRNTFSPTLAIEVALGILAIALALAAAIAKYRVER